MTTDITVDVHLAPDADGARARSRRARRPRRHAEDAPAEVVLRRPRERAVRRDHPSARVLPDPHRTGDPARRTRATSPSSPRPTRSSSWAPGTSEKTRILLDAFRDAGTLDRFVPFDVSEQTLRDAAAAVAREYDGVRVHAVVGDFEHHLGQLPDGGTRVVAFLGSTIGNLAPGPRAAVPRRRSPPPSRPATRSCWAPIS